MRKYIRIGVDIAKNSFQVHALENEDCSATKRKLSRSGIVKFLAEVEPCAIGMEACGSAHYWARRFRAMGHEVKLTPPIYVKPYVKRGKNDAADAAAICEAMSRPNMRFVAVKSEDQQATLMAHKTRELLIKQALRGHLAEFGVIAAKGISHVEELVERAAGADLRRWSRRRWGFCLRNCGLSTRRSTSSSAQLSPTIDAIRSAGWRRASPASARSPLRRFWPARQIRTPSKSGRDFAAWLGATPKQNSTGGKEKLGSITKQGNRYIRRLLVLGAISVLRAAPKRKGALCDWLAALRARKPPKVVAVALANSPGSSGRSSPPARPSAAPSTLRPDPNPGQRTRKENAGSRVWRARRRRDERHGETIEDHRTLRNGSGAQSSPP
jgi:transposase